MSFSNILEFLLGCLGSSTDIGSNEIVFGFSRGCSECFSVPVASSSYSLKIPIFPPTKGRKCGW